LLLVVHGYLLTLYALTSVPGLVLTAGIPGADRIAAAIAGGMPGLSPGTAGRLLFHWHTWGWDTLPLLLWLPGSGLWRSWTGAPVHKSTGRAASR
jgi:hypothetical protein